MKRDLMEKSEIVPIEKNFDLTPAAGAKIETDTCPTGLKAGDVVYIDGWVHFCGEKDQPIGRKVVFTRYAYSHKVWYFPIRKYAFFRFPDGSERSLMAGSFTTVNPRSLRGLARRLTKNIRRVCGKVPSLLRSNTNASSPV